MISKIYSQKRLVLQSFITFTGLSSFQLLTWLPLRYWGAWGGGNFLDAWQILRYGKCYATVGLSVYDDSGTNCSNYLYGRTLLQLLSLLGVDVSQTQILGYSFLLLLAVGLSLIFPIESKMDCAVFALVVFSPPVMLLADRGNFDILIFFLLVVVAKSVTRGNVYLAYFLLTITVLLKYYTAPVFLLIMLHSKQTKEKVLGIVLLLTSAALSFRDISITQAQYPHGSDSQFGFSIWGEYLNRYSSTQVDPLQGYLVSALIFLSVSLVVLFLIRNFLRKEEKFTFSQDWRSFSLYIFFTVSITCFFGGMNFDYRLIFFAASLLLLRKIKPNYYRQGITNTLVLVLWLSFPSGGLQPVGDLIIECVVAFSLVFAGTNLLRQRT